MSADAQPWPPEAELFRCEVSPDGDSVRLRPIGELDLVTAPILDTRLTDLRGLLFIDSTGLHVILRHDAEARRDGFSLALIPGSPAVQRVFDIAGVTTRLPFVDV